MTEILADERLKEVMDRTMCNLRFIHDRCSDDGPFEVVQLVNSFSGAMAHPWEEMKRLKSLNLSQSIEAARDRGWPVLDKELPTDSDPKDYGEMLRWIRNGFAHGNIDFKNANGSIVRIQVWNCPIGRPRNWGTVVDVRVMEDFLWFFQDLASGRIPEPRAEEDRIMAHAAD